MMMMIMVCWIIMMFHDGHTVCVHPVCSETHYSYPVCALPSFCFFTQTVLYLYLYFLYLYLFLFLFQLYLYLRKITPTQSVHYPSFFWFCAIAIALCAGIFCCEHLCALAIALCVFAIAIVCNCIVCSGMFYCEHLDTLLTHWTAAATY